MTNGLESNLEDEVVRWAKDEGGRALKLKIENERGMTDRTIILPERRIIFPELKRPKGSTKRYEQQKRMIEWLQSMGFPAGFCQTLDEVKRLLDD